MNLASKCSRRSILAANEVSKAEEIGKRPFGQLSLAKIEKKTEKNAYLLTSGAHNSGSVNHKDLPIDSLESPTSLPYFDA